jgi:hypothetical protein
MVLIGSVTNRNVTMVLIGSVTSRNVTMVLIRSVTSRNVTLVELHFIDNVCQIFENFLKSFLSWRDWSIDNSFHTSVTFRILSSDTNSFFAISSMSDCLDKAIFWGFKYPILARCYIIYGEMGNFMIRLFLRFVGKKEKIQILNFTDLPDVDLSRSN